MLAELINDDEKLLENSFVVPDAALADVSPALRRASVNGHAQPSRNRERPRHREMASGGRQPPVCLRSRDRGLTPPARRESAISGRQRGMTARRAGGVSPLSAIGGRQRATDPGRAGGVSPLSAIGGRQRGTHPGERGALAPCLLSAVVHPR